MYLVHTALHHPEGVPLPAAAAVAAACLDNVEHASVHPDARPHPVLALYIRAGSLTAAAAVAADAWHTAAAQGPMEGWAVVRIRAHLLAADIAENPSKSD